MPGAVRVMIEINQGFDWAFRWTVGSYYQMLNRLVLGVGAAFQFPLVIVVLSWLGLVSAAGLRKYRRHAIVAIFIIAAVVTPSTEPLSQTMLAAPLYLLFEIAIVLASRVEKRRQRPSAVVVIALLALLPRRREPLVQSGLSSRANRPA
jgi:sec-independent protein translocase protein TatC